MSQDERERDMHVWAVYDLYDLPAGDVLRDAKDETAWMAEGAGETPVTIRVLRSEAMRTLIAGVMTGGFHPDVRQRLQVQRARLADLQERADHSEPGAQSLTRDDDDDDVSCAPVTGVVQERRHRERSATNAVYVHL